MSDVAITADERGDTLSPGGRSIARILTLLALAAITVGTVIATNSLASQGNAQPAPSDAAEVASTASTGAEETGPVALVDAEDLRIHTVLERTPAVGMTLDSEYNTLVLGQRAEPYTLADLLAAGVAQPMAEQSWMLHSHVLVRGGATLRLDQPGTTLLLASDSERFVSIIGWGATVELLGAENRMLQVSASGGGATDEVTRDGRAYIRVHDGSLLAEHVALSDLGFWSGRTGGLAVTSSLFRAVTATLTDTTHEDLHRGLFVSGAAAVTVSGVVITDPRTDGITLSNGTVDVTIDSVTIEGAQDSGIVINKGSEDIRIANTSVSGSGGWGMDIDGRPRAGGPNAEGYTTAMYRGVTISAATLLDNAGGGIRVRSMHDVHISGTDVRTDAVSLAASGVSLGLSVATTELTSAAADAVHLDGSVTATIASSGIEGYEHAILLTGDDVNLRVTSATLTVGYRGHALYAEGDETVTLQNVGFVGMGPATTHTGGDHAVTMEGINDSEWQTQPEILAWLADHPIGWLWLLVLVIPAVGLPLLSYRDRKHKALRAKFEATMVQYGAFQMAAYGDDHPAVVGPGPRMSALAAPASHAGAAAGPATPPEVVAPAIGATPARSARPPAPATARVAHPRSLNDLRTGVLAGRQFASMRDFAVAAVLEAGYPVDTIAQLFRFSNWRLQEWVIERAEHESGMRELPPPHA